MSVILQAPLPNVQTTTILPSPRFSDVLSRSLSLNKHYSMTGVQRTYVKTNQRYRLSFDFQLTRMKALELQAFLQAYYRPSAGGRSSVRLTTHENVIYEGHFMNNPFELAGSGRANEWPGSEGWSANILFEGTQV